MNPDFSEFFNVTVPCGVTCSIKHVTPDTCRLLRDKAMWLTAFKAKHISPAQALAQADPLTVIHRSGNSTSTFLYTRPPNAKIKEDFTSFKCSKKPIYHSSNMAAMHCLLYMSIYIEYISSISVIIGHRLVATLGWRWWFTTQKT